MVDIQRHGGVARAVRRGYHGQGGPGLQLSVRRRREAPEEPVYTQSAAEGPQV